MKGMEISKSFYDEFGKQMIKEQFGAFESKIAVGLVGSGSECFGFDDQVSTDHDFDPGFCIFIPDDINDDVKFQMERAYAKLPREYKGYVREIMSPVGGNRRGIKRISDFLKEKTGTIDGNLSIYDWFNIPEESLAELTNGEIWRDDSKVFTKIRYKLSTFPEDIKLKKLAGETLIMAQSGQYNYKRCIEHNEFGAARLSAYEFVNAAIHVAFLLNEVYTPYYKWKFRTLRNLSWPNGFKIKNESVIPFEKVLVSLLSLNDEEMIDDKTINDIDMIAKLFIDRFKSDGMSEKDDIYLEKHAYEINNKIKDNDIRNMNILTAI